MARRVRLASEDQLTVIQPEQLPAGPAQLLALTPHPELISAVVLDVRGGDGLLDGSLDLASRFEQQHPNVGVLLVAEETADLALKALRAGAKDVIDPDAEISDLRWALRRAAEAAVPVEGRGASDGYSGRVITVAAPKGGVGKTTVATNLARVLAEESPRGVVLVDLDVQFGDVAAALDLEPEFTIGDIFAGAALGDPIALKTHLASHGSGLQVACGVASPEEADVLTVEKISKLLEVLRNEFRYVVIDTAPGLSEHVLTALDFTTDLVLVTSLDVPSVRGLRKELEVLDRLPLPPHTRHVVLNNADKMAGLTVTDVEATIGRRVDVTLPRSATVLKSTNMGQPIVESAPRDRVSKDLRKLASRFVGAPSHRGKNLLRRGAN